MKTATRGSSRARYPEEMRRAGMPHFSYIVLSNNRSGKNKTTGFCIGWLHMFYKIQ